MRNFSISINMWNTENRYTRGRKYTAHRPTGRDLVKDAFQKKNKPAEEKLDARQNSGHRNWLISIDTVELQYYTSFRCKTWLKL